MKVVTKHIEGLPADQSARNEVKVEASAQAGSEFIIKLPIAWADFALEKYLSRPSHLIPKKQIDLNFRYLVP